MWPLRGINLQHVFTTSYLSHTPIDTFISAHQKVNTNQLLYISSGRAIGLRLIPTERDLRFLWEESSYIQVSRMRGQQLKDVSQLDGWSGNGAKDYITNLGLWE